MLFASTARRHLLGRARIFLPILCASTNIGQSQSFNGNHKFLGRFKLTRPALLNPLALASSTTSPSTSSSSATCDMGDNPLLGDWSTEPFKLPPFDRIEPNHFPSAFDECMKRHIEDLKAIVDNTDEPTFENVLVPYDRAGSLLSRTGSVFYNMCSSLNTDDMKEVQSSMVPILSRHRSSTYTMPGLFEKIQAVYDQRLDDASNLTDEQVRLVERVHMDFTRAGANFEEEQKKEYAELQAELASLQTTFQQNVMKDEETYEMVLNKEDLEGCPDSLVEAAKQVATERGYNKEGQDEGETKYIITLSRSLVEPFLTFSSRRDLRQQAWKAWTSRGELDPSRDNLSIGRDILRLRQKQAKMHGYSTFAEYQCVDRMAKTPENVMDLLENVWGRAKVCADNERAELEEYAKKMGEDVDGGIKPWDWRYYAEKVRIEKYDLDEAIVKPYFSLDKVVEALFAVSNQLFGLKYVKRTDMKLYHPDVVAYEVRKGEKEDLQAIFLHDNFARPFKSSGAWMSEYRSQTKNLPPTADSIESVPIVANNNNFAKGGDSDSENSPTLLSFDDAKTLFHEMGHGHHGMLSDATYSRLSSTSVLQDFVELPSQLMEHWFDEPEVLKKYARHFETDEPIPDNLLAKIQAAKLFQEGFRTIEYTSCALMDMALHSLSEYPDDFDLTKFEEEELGRLGMPAGIVMRHRPAHFSHLFATSSYAAGYYVYLWAEVLDADAYAAFEETGDVFDSDTAEKARKYIYSAGNTVAPDELFRQFRGRDPDISFLLKKRGLTSSGAPAS